MNRPATRPWEPVALAAAVLVASLLGQALLSHTVGDGPVAKMVASVLAAAVTVAALWWMRMGKLWGRGITRPVSTLLWMAVFLVGVSLTTIVPVANAVAAGSASWPSAGQILVHTIHVTSTALHEETAFRAILLGGLVWTLAGRRHGQLIAVVISTLAFGAAHLVGLFGHPASQVVPQAVYTLFLGALFAALYIRSGNLWIPIIAHAAFNWLGTFVPVPHHSSKPMPTSQGTGSPWAVVLAQIPWLIIAVVMITRDLRAGRSALPRDPRALNDRPDAGKVTTTGAPGTETSTPPTPAAPAQQG